MPAETFPDLEDIGIRLTLNGKVVQDGNSNMMLNPIVPMIQHMAANFSLQAGDLIMTGTPAGVGPFETGDQIALELVGQTPFESVVR